MAFFKSKAGTSGDREATTPEPETFRDDYSVGWIAALPHERAAAMVMLDDEYPKPIDFEQPSTDKNSYSWGQMGDHKIVVTSLADGVYGTMSASTTASRYVCFVCCFLS